MTSYQIPGGSILTPIRDIFPHFLERDEKIISIEPKNLTITIEFLEDPSTNRNDSEPNKDFWGSKEDKGTSGGNNKKYT